ncbi:HECT domain-containing protein [Caerostris extrusa]|uniref:HECT domain-containing protein n=1 Tax=Caerostris extrusa TaxID=172846 RepID=A0AAV4T315_CAEEX|nr:HECT domain-containing protein [Caerostris extrusa]
MANQYYTSVSFVVFVFALLLLYQLSTDVSVQQEKELENVLIEYDLAKYKDYIYLSSCTSVVALVKFWSKNNEQSLPSLPDENIKLDLIEKAENIKQHLILHHLLKKWELLDVKKKFFNSGFDSLEKLRGADVTQFKSKFSRKQLDTWVNFKESLSIPDEDFLNLLRIYVGIFILSLCVALFTGMVLTMSQPRLEATYGNQKLGLLSYVTGRYLSPLKCKVAFDWTEPQVVGDTMSFTVKFFQRNGNIYPICNQDHVLIEISQGTYKIACNVQLGGQQLSDINTARVQFTVRRAGEYRICVLVGMTHIHGSPFLKYFVPGPPDPTKTCFVHHSSTVVGSEDIPTQLFIEPRDKYGNLCTVEKIGTIQNGDFHVIILNQEESLTVQKNVAKKNKCYEVKLLALNSERFPKPKKIYCYISPKQLTLKEYMWKFFSQASDHLSFMSIYQV